MLHVSQVGIGELMRLENGLAAYGVGLNFRLGFLELNWVFAQRTRFGGDSGDRWRSAFYIGNKF